MTFVFVSGNLALDFVGTVQHRRTDALDLLASPQDLSRWIAQAGLVDTPVSVTPEGLERAVRLREAVYRLACAVRDRQSCPETVRELLNREAAAAPVTIRLTAEGTAERVGGLDAVLATLARSAIELVTGPLVHSIKECAAEECTRLYVDRSRRGSRRWCDIRWCGNRAKAASFRARHRR